MSHFAFLQPPEWSFLHESATRAEGLAQGDPRGSCFYARRTLELAVDWLYRHDPGLRPPYQDSLSARLHEPGFRATVGETLFTKARVIKDLGNLAVHGSRRMAPQDAINATRELFHFCYWLARTYGRLARPAPGLRFDPALLPAATGSAPPPRTAAQLQRLEAEIIARDEQLRAAQARHAALDEELRQLRERIAAAKAANLAEPDRHDYSEAQTRRVLIDLLLREAGWRLDPARDCEVAVTGMPTPGGRGYVDYVLWREDGRPLALIEAKRGTQSPSAGQQQAKLYADCLEAMFGQRPIIFYSNGYEHWLWDDLNYPPRPVQGFYKPAELALLIQRRRTRQSLAATPLDESIAGRHYQVRGIRRFGEAFERDRLRKALGAHATGTGKTRLAIGATDLLMRANWAKRALFLADRKALVTQAVKAFQRHLPAVTPVNLLVEREGESRVLVSTYPTMMGLIEDFVGEERRFGVGHFDLIIVDEAHRSIYHQYRALFDYFDALLIGLTATPRDEVDRNTYALFELEEGVPTDAYSLEEAVADGFLVPPLAVSVPLKFQREGIRYEELSEEEKDQWDALEWNEDGSTPQEVDPAALNAWLFNEDTVDRVLEHLMTHGHRVAGGDRLGKTIVFAKNNDHAEFIARRFDVHYPHLKGEFARVISYRTAYADTLIEAFGQADQPPHIAISVDMLDTGIDVPEVVNLVFFKQVRSKTKFWQMLGRGTRLCPDLFGPGRDKENFYLFDYCQNLEYFSLNPDSAGGAVAESLGARLFKTRLALIAELDRKLGPPPELAETERAPDYGGQPSEPRWRFDLAEGLRAQVAAMPLDNFVVRPQRQVVERYREAAAWQRLGVAEQEALATRVAGLPSALADADEAAKRFDLLVLRAQLALLRGTPDIAGPRDRLQAIARALEEQGAIPAVRAELVLIQSLASDELWQDPSAPWLELARRRLRGLVRLIPPGERRLVYTDFQDELGEAVAVDLPPLGAGLDLARFKAKARRFLKEHGDHLALQRLRRNQALTATDLTALEEMLAQAGGTPALIAAARAQSQGLGLFIRSLVGLDREAAMAAFSDFIQGATVTPDQLEFIQLIVEELTQNGVMAPERLFQSPYTDVHDRGPLGIFPPARVTQMLGVLAGIRERAA